MTGRLAGKFALITGGTSGIGAATARIFAAEGAHVAITGRRVDLGEKVAKTLQEKGVKGVFIQADHARLEDCERSVAEAARSLGGLDILFNNAGVVMGGTAETTSEADWAYTLDLNLTACWRMSRLALPHLRLRGSGVIVNNASDWGVVGTDHAFAYAVSKAALVQLTRCMALELAAEKIRINAVCPGDTFVDRWLEKGYFAASDPVTLEQARAESAAYLPMKRFAEPEEIARAVLFLACDDSSFMTGQALVVDGGNTAR
jgi:meso-butanediol dehydrogenase/(S,S)-butanediol dehydrogenase/diacetyl reductase